MPLLPAMPKTPLQVRLWDRFHDLRISQPMQKIVIDAIRPSEAKDPFGVNEARANLDVAYRMIERHMQKRLWATGDNFSIADCAALPALFFASIVHPFAADQVAVAAYFERLLAHPSVRRVLSDARPYFALFPYRDVMPARFLEAAT